MTQEMMVLDYLQSHNGITSKDAFRDLGITRLSAKIFNLKEQGYSFVKVTEKSKDRYGKPCHFTRYILLED